MLPKPEGRLSTAMPSSSIAAANKEVKQILDKANKPEENSAKRGAYEHFTLEAVAYLRQGLAGQGPCLIFKVPTHSSGQKLRKEGVKIKYAYSLFDAHC